MKTRQFLRVSVPMAVRVSLAEQEDEFRSTTIKDISWGGAFVVLEPPPPLDTRVIVEFTLVDENVSLELWGTVVRVEEEKEGRPAGVGVKFDELDEDSRTLIQRLVDEEVASLIKSI